jgi:hypothetical protein
LSRFPTVAHPEQLLGAVYQHRSANKDGIATMTDNYIGVDVSRAWIDTFCLQTKAHARLPMDPTTLDTFAAKLGGKGVIVVLEATGGYERPLLSALEYGDMIRIKDMDCPVCINLIHIMSPY